MNLDTEPIAPDDVDESHVGRRPPTVFTHMDLSNQFVREWGDAFNDPERASQALAALTFLFQEAQLGSDRPVLNRMFEHVTAARALLTEAIGACIDLGAAEQNERLLQFLLDISHLLYFTIDDIAEVEAITTWENETAH